MSETHQKFAVFWGCTIPFRLPWIEVAARKVLPELGVEIIDLPFSCCPDPIASKALDHQTWLSLAARNLCLAEEQNLHILTLCSGCFETLKMAQKILEDKEKKSEVNRILQSIGREYRGTIQVNHFQQWLYQEIGPESLEKRVIHPLTLRAATHVGCHFTRPAEVLHTDDPVYPEQLDELCQVLGIETVDYPDKNLCCGVGVGLVDRDVSKNLLRRKIKGAHRAQAEAMVAHCPSCIQTFDLGQAMLSREGSESSKMLPVFYYLELLGLALGINREEFAFEEHRVPVTPVLIER